VQARLAGVEETKSNANKKPQFTPKMAFPFDDLHPLSNTSIPRPTPFTAPNGIRIQLVVMSQYTLRSDRQTDRPSPWTDRPTNKIFDKSVRIPAYALLIVSDAAKTVNTK